MDQSQCYRIGSSTLCLVLGDIADATTEVIATSDDTKLSMGGGSSWAVRQAAGESVYEAMRGVPLQLGKVAASGPGQLEDRGVKRIFHAATIPSAADRAVDDESGVIKSVTRQCLDMMRAEGFESIAMPAFGTGFAKFDATSAAVTMAGVIRSYLEQSDQALHVEIRLLTGKRDDLATLQFFGEFTRQAQLESVAVHKHTVALIHGIRTQASWRESISRELSAAQPPLFPVPIRYGYFDVFRFLWPFEGPRAKAASIVKQKTQPLFDNPVADVSVVAHSFGTWITTYLLRTDPNFVLRRLVLCGSVVDDNFDWGSVQDKLGDPYSSEAGALVMNDCGNKDIWPVLAQSVTWGYGASGRNGFGHALVKDRFHDMAHSGFFEGGFPTAFWVGALNDSIEPGDSRGIGTPWLISLLSVFRLKYLILIVIAVVVVVLLA